MTRRRRDIPRLWGFDSTLALVREGYTFASRRAARCGADAWWGRIMLRRTVVAGGADGTRQFYEPGRMTRRGAQLLPARILQDPGTVQTLDGVKHETRKTLLMSLLDDAALQRLTGIFEHHWRRAVPRWAAQPEVDLLHEVRLVLCRTACDWVGIASDGLPRRTNDLALLVEAAGSFSPRLVWARYVRVRTLSWAEDAVVKARARADRVETLTPLQAIADHEPDGGPLPSHVAAGEVLNFLRPIVAVAHFVVFAAIALHEHPRAATALDSDPRLIEPFVEEVRRYYPFFPFVAGRVLEPFEWRGRRFKKGARIFLDLYGTNHHPDLWSDPEVFCPHRLARETTPFPPIAQGFGDLDSGHRCAGDRATVVLIAAAVRMLRTTMTYDVPPQDLGISLGKIPALPANGFVMANIHPR